MYAERSLPSRIRNLAAMLALAASSLLAAPQGPVVLQFHTAASVDRESILLRDVADITGAAPELRQQLESTVLAYAPQPGLTQMVGRERVLRLLQKTFPVSFQPVGAEMVSVRREARTLDFEAMVPRLIDWMAGNWGIEPSAFRLREVKIPGNLYLPDGHQTFSFEKGVREGEVLLGIQVGSFHRSVTAQVSASAVVKVAVAGRNLPFGATPTVTDIRFEERELVRSPWMYVRDAGQLRMVTLKEPVREGQPLALDSFRPETIIRRGAPVTISYQDRTVSLAVPGKALRAGTLGQLIEVQNTGSGRVLSARVVAPGAVRVECMQ